MNTDPKLLQNLQEIGWQVVLIPEDEEGPAFAFTLGLGYSFGHPEILIMGMELQLMHQLLNNMGDDVKRGFTFQEGEESANVIEGYKCAFRSIHKSNYREVLGSAVGFYGNEDFPVLQCVWPDKEGFYPGQQEFDSKFSGFQWWLWKPLSAG